MKTIAALLFSALFATPTPFNLPSPFELMARQVLTDFNSGCFEGASKDFNDSMKSTVTPAVLASMKKQFDAQLGAFRAITATRQATSADGLRLADVTAKYEKATVLMRVEFDRNYRIAAIYFDPVQPKPIDAALEATAREWLTAFRSGNYDAAVKPFSPTLKSQLPPSLLAELARKIAYTYGKFGAVTEVAQTEQAPYKTIELTAAPLVVHVVFDEAGRIAGVNVGPAK